MQLNNNLIQKHEIFLIKIFKNIIIKKISTYKHK